MSRVQRAAHFLKAWTSNKQAYAQIIEGDTGRIVASASTAERGLKNSSPSSSSATSTSSSTTTTTTAAPATTTPVASNDVASCAEAGVRLAQRAAAADVKEASWRRARGQRYHGGGRVASLLGAARDAGLSLK